MTPFQVRGKPPLRKTDDVEPIVQVSVEYAMTFVKASWPSKFPSTNSLKVEPSYVALTKWNSPAAKAFWETIKSEVIGPKLKRNRPSVARQNNETSSLLATEC